MSNIPMEGLAEQLRKLCRTANPEACEIYERWASEVEAAQAALSAGQEPVAWMPECGSATTDADVAASWRKHGGKVAPLFAHPAPKGEAEEVLRELVSIKDTYARLHRLHEMGHGTDYDQTRKAEAAAWDRARALVADGVDSPDGEQR